MSSSITSLGDLHVVVSDGIIAVWMHFALQILAETREFDPWVKDIRSRWERLSSIAGGGVLDLGFEVFAKDERRRRVLLEICHRVLERILSHDEVISQEELNSMDQPGQWTRDVEVELFARFGRSLIRLLERDTRSDNRSLPIEVWHMT